METIITAAREAFAPHVPAIMAALASIVSTLVLAGLASAATAIRRLAARIGLDIERAQADKLTAALGRAAQLALERRLDKDAAVALMVAYLRETVPDAVAVLKPSGQALRMRAEAALASVYGPEHPF